MYYRSGKFTEALSMLNKVVSKLPNDKQVYLQRGLVF